jgi:hypothetical protein
MRIDLEDGKSWHYHGSSPGWKEVREATPEVAAQ